MELEPRHHKAWNELGMSYMREGQFDRAAVAFQKQLGVDPSHPQAHNYLGIVLEKQRKYDAAALAFRQQIELNPLDTVAHAAFGAIYLSQHDDAQAVPELDKAAALSPDKAELQVSLGQAYVDLGQNQKALAAFDKAVRAIAHSDDLEQRLPKSGRTSARTRARLSNTRKQPFRRLCEASHHQPAHVWRPSNSARVQTGKLLGHARLGVFSERRFRRGTALHPRRVAAEPAWRHQPATLPKSTKNTARRTQAIHTYALALAAPIRTPTLARASLCCWAAIRRSTSSGHQAAPLWRLGPFSAGKLDKSRARSFSSILSPALHPSQLPAPDVRFLGGSEELRPWGAICGRSILARYFRTASPVKSARRGTLELFGLNRRVQSRVDFGLA